MMSGRKIQSQNTRTLGSKRKGLSHRTVQVMGSKEMVGTSLVAQWLRIRRPMQGTRVRALVREDPTCHRATKPVRRNY